LLEQTDVNTNSDIQDSMMLVNRTALQSTILTASA